MSLFKSLNIDEIRQRGTIRDVDVQSMRRSMTTDGAISMLEADLLLMLNTACKIKDASWTDFFVDTLTDYVVHQIAPEGYVTTANAEWLTLRFSQDGRITNHAELELVANILTEARWAPLSLSRLLLTQVRDAVVTGQGPLRAGTTVGAGAITDGEVNLARRVLTACEDELPVTQAEAEALFEINAALLDPAAHRGWTDLYASAIANAVLWSAGYSVPGRSETLDPNPESELRADSMIRIGLDRPSDPPQALPQTLVFSTNRPHSPEERALARLQRQRIEIITSDEILEPNITWLVERIESQPTHEPDTVGPNERKVLALVERHSPSLHPALAQLVAKAAFAAA